MPPRRRRWPRIALAAAGAAVLLGAGYGIGAASSSQQATVSSLRSQLATAQSRLSTAQADLVTARGQAQQAQAAQAQAEAAAKTAQARADAAAKAKYADRMTQAQAALDAAKKQQDAIAAEAGQLNASEISADGVYVVGQDIKVGTWHTPGGSECYYALLNSTDTSDIADNNNINGPATATLSRGAFEISGGCSWYRVSG